MTFLGGMDRKQLRQTNSNYQNDIAPEWWSSSNNPPCNAKSHYHGKAQRNKKLQNSFACLDAENNAEGMHLTDQLFHGFQTIRSHEKDLFITHLATPTFATYAQNMMKNETKTTKDELRLVKKNLEKSLFNCDGKSRRGSTNTCGGKLLDKAAKNQDKEIAIPPQPCTCGSKDRLPKINTPVKNRRTSLRELFQKIKMSEEKPEPISNLTKTEKDKPSVHLTKKILKEKTIHPSVTRSAAASVGTIESATADEKLHKILHMLQRVYPEASAILKKSQNLWKYVTNSNYTYEEGHRNRNNQILSKDVIIKFPYNKAISDISANQTRNKASRPIYSEGDTKWNSECWIKSDAEYLILEL